MLNFKFYISLTVLLLSVLWVGVGAASSDSRLLSYRVTIHNLSTSQPLSPAVGATHSRKINMFETGSLSSPGLEAIAENGNQLPMFGRFDASHMVTGLFGGEKMPPLIRNGTTHPVFTDALTRDLMALPKDRFSLATMLICSNDGFTGLDRVRLPDKGAKVFLLSGYDAGTEDNTEESEHIVDPCGGLGAIPLPGDGNINDEVDTDPHQPIMVHENIQGGADLTIDDHGWVDPVAKVTITRVAPNARKFIANLTGAAENPMVATSATGKTQFKMTGKGLDYSLNLHLIVGVTGAHIHMGMPNINGGVVAFLFSAGGPTGAVNGNLVKGVITVDDLAGGPFDSDWEGFMHAMRNGMLYVNVHTEANPPGEIRGQIGVSFGGS